MCGPEKYNDNNADRTPVVTAVVHPILQGPAEGLVDELQVSVKSVFEVVIAHVYAEWPELQAVIMEQVSHCV